MKKKKLLVAALCGALTVGTIGGAYAYFTNVSDTAKNTFSIVKGGKDEDKGQIPEPDWDPDKAEELQPGEIINKDPLFVNTADYPVYVFLEISYPTVKNEDASGNIQINKANVAAKTPLVTFQTIDTNKWTKVATTEEDGKTTEVWGYNTILAAQEADTTAFPARGSQTAAEYKAAVEGYLATLTSGSYTESLFDTFTVANFTKYDTNTTGDADQFSIDVTAKTVQAELELEDANKTPTYIYEHYIK